MSVEQAGHGQYGQRPGATGENVFREEDLDSGNSRNLCGCGPPGPAAKDEDSTTWDGSQHRRKVPTGDGQRWELRKILGARFQVIAQEEERREALC